MKKLIYKAGLIICMIISVMMFSGCDPNDENAVDPYDAVVSTWQDLQSGFTTIIKDNGTYSVSLGATVWQTGTWSTNAGNITFNPQGDESVTMQYSISADGNTMTIVYDGETTVLKRL